MRGVVTLAAAFVIPEDTAAPRGAAADRVHRRGRHAVPPGPVAAVAGPPAAGAVARPGRGRAGPRHLLQQASKAGLRRARRARVRRPARRRRADPAAARAAQLRRLGAARHRRRPGDAERALRPDPARDDRGRAARGCWRSAAPAPSPPRWSTTCWRMLDVEESMLDTADRGARASCASATPRWPPAATARPRAATRPVETGHDPASASDCLARAPAGCTCGSASSCGHVGCCDSSPGRHATAHFHDDRPPGDAVRRARRGLALVLRPPPHCLTVQSGPALSGVPMPRRSSPGTAGVLPRRGQSAIAVSPAPAPACGRGDRSRAARRR